MKDLFRTSKKTLVILAALVWFIGAVMLFRGGWELLSQARELRPGSAWHWLFIGLGIVLGIVQARTIFTRSCRRNIQRIRELQDPSLWQFFRPGFFLALGVMISAGVLLDIFSQGIYFFMLAVVGIDFALTISLLGSSRVFWQEKID
jgi:uncharacterized membrane protein